MKNKTIIIFDGHGSTNQERTLLKYTHYFLCEAGETLGSDVFNKIVKQIVKDKGLTDLSHLQNNHESQIEHTLYQLTQMQKLSSSSCNLRKALNVIDVQKEFRLHEISEIISDNEINYDFTIQYTNFHPETKCRLVYVRVENNQPIQLSILEKLIFPIFIDSENPTLESCGMGMNEFTESEAIGLWGACREFI